MFNFRQIGLSAFIVAQAAVAQVRVDKPIVLTGASAEDRQITGLPASTVPQDVLTAAVEQANTYRTASPQPNTTWAITLPALNTAPAAGIHLVVIAPTPTDGDVAITINGNGPYPLWSGPDEPLDGATIVEGTALSVVHDGNAFHLLNGSTYERRACPEGMVAANAVFCVEIADRTPVDLFTAITTCGDRGARLCSWGEWVVACEKATTLGLLNPTNNWEWTGDASNENGSARIVGLGSCLSAGNALVTGSIDRGFRCCYSR